MRILMVHNRYQAAGGEDISTDAQVTLLRDAGHEVVLLADTNERIAELGRLRTAARSIWSRDAKHQVSEVLRDGGFDVMHVQNFFPLFSPSIYYAADEHGVPVVQSLRNFRALCPAGMLYRDGAVCTDCVGKKLAWTGITNRCYRESAAGTAVVALMSSGHRAAGTWRRKVARYVTPSAFARDTYVRAGWSADKINVIPNFVYPDPGPADGHRDYAIYAGRLVPPKGLDSLIEAWNRGGFDLPLKIAGEGPLKHFVREAAASNPHIEFLGEKSPNEVSDLVGDAMFSVVPTLGIETFGRVAAESMARGTPPIVANHGGLAEIVTDGESGLVFRPGDVSSLIEAIASMLGDRARLQSMRKAARSEFLDRFTGERVLGSWLELYDEVSAGQ